MEEQFRFFKRVTYEKIGKLSQKELIMRMKKNQRILCIVNTKKTAQELYKKLQEEGENIYHLSTNMYPQHRKQRCTRGYKRYKETSGLIEWKECQIFHSIFT